MPADLTLVPTAALRLVLDANDRRALPPDETHALEDLGRALKSPRPNGCTDLRGSWRECRSCRVPECPHGRGGAL